MKRNEQMSINERVENAVIAAYDEYNVIPIMSIEKLRHCKAEVIETPHWYILRSYNTLIAAVNKETVTGYDFLRLVYGYTATSAQHISKFFHDYGVRGVGGSGLEITWREV